LTKLLLSAIPSGGTKGNSGGKLLLEFS